uniref:G-protein coupled receptors family 1 profile domain-containing protein n=1 Tax=Panagrolaimus sp. PS1159 TaxID=55785 RepID=A0AC35GWQ3_9BILA
MSWRTLGIVEVEVTTPLSSVTSTEDNGPVLPSFYELFKDHGIIKEIMPCIAAYLFLLLFGLYGNFSVAYCTFRHKQLHGTCGILLSVGAIGDSVHQFSHFYMLYLMFSGQTFTYLQTC